MEAFFISMMIAATPILFAGIGELVAERSGVLNLGVEGMMLMGAVVAFLTALSTGSPVLGVLAGAGAQPVRRRNGADGARRSRCARPRSWSSRRRRG